VSSNTLIVFFYFFRAGRVCNTTTTNKKQARQLRNYFSTAATLPKPKSTPCPRHILGFNWSTTTAAASSTDIELANRSAVRRGDYLLKILTRYNFTKDLVKSFSSQLQPATQKPSIYTTLINIPSIPSLYATSTPPSPSLPQFALLGTRSGSTDLPSRDRKGTRA